MAADTYNADSDVFLTAMEEFPCMFNLPPCDIPSINRLDLLSQKLNEEKESCIDKDERRMQLNLLTWLYFQLHNFPRAREINGKVLNETENGSVVALGNGAFLDWYKKKGLPGNLELLREMSTRPDFQVKCQEAKSEQAYCLERLGNMSNLTVSVGLYEELLRSEEDREDWRSKLGMAYRRLAVAQSTNGKYISHCLTHTEYFRRAEECFRHVEENSHNEYLRSLALTQLAEICIGDTSGGNALLEGKAEEVVEIVNKAFTIEGSDTFYEVLLGCGKALVKIDTEWSIILLNKAINISEESVVGHHYLGKAFILLSQQKDSAGKTRTDYQCKAIHHLTKAYDNSNCTLTRPLLELSSMSDKQKAKTHLWDLIESRFNRGNLIAVHKKMFSFLEKRTSTYKKHLLLAILASINAMSDDSPTEECNYVWANFFENEKQKLTHFKSNSLFEMLQKHGKMTKAVPKLVDMVANEEIDVPAVAIRMVDQFISQCKTEEALLLLELLLLRPQTCVPEVHEIHIKTLLVQAERSLTDGFAISSLFFRKAFNLSYHNRSEHNAEVEPEAPSIIVDIVLFFHDPYKTEFEEDLDGDDEESLCADTARGMEEAISTLFDLKVICNPSLRGMHGQEGSHPLENFVQKHQSKLVLLLAGKDKERVESYLHLIEPLLQGATADQPTVALVQCDQDSSLKLPPLLSQLPRLWLRCQREANPVSSPSIPNHFRSKTAQNKAHKGIEMKKIVEAYFDGNQEDVSTLFTFLIKPGPTNTEL